MSSFKFLSIVLITATTVVGPALARARHEASRHANTSVASVAGNAQGRGCMSAPRWILRKLRMTPPPTGMTPWRTREPNYVGGSGPFPAPAG